MSQSFTIAYIPWPFTKVGAHLNIFRIQVPPITLDFKKPFFCWPGNPGIFPKSLPRWLGFDGLQNNPRGSLGGYKQLELTWTLS